MFRDIVDDQIPAMEMRAVPRAKTLLDRTGFGKSKGNFWGGEEQEEKGEGRVG